MIKNEIYKNYYLFDYTKVGEISQIRLFGKISIYSKVGNAKCLFGFIWGN